MIKNIKIPGAIFQWYEMWEDSGETIQATVRSCDGFYDLDEFVELVNSSILKDYSDWILCVDGNKTRLTNPETKDYFLGDAPDDNPLTIPGIELYFNKFNPNEDTIEITYEEYNRLKDDSGFLNILEGNGVDNWVGYSDSYKQYLDWKD